MTDTTRALKRTRAVRADAETTLFSFLWWKILGRCPSCGNYKRHRMLCSLDGRSQAGNRIRRTA